MQDIKPQVRQYIVDNLLMGAQDLKLSDTESFMQNHVIDSTGFLELIAFLEDTFGIRVEDEEMVPENLDSLAAIQAFVARKRGA